MPASDGKCAASIETELHGAQGHHTGVCGSQCPSRPLRLHDILRCPLYGNIGRVHGVDGVRLLVSPRRHAARPPAGVRQGRGDCGGGWRGRGGYPGNEEREGERSQGAARVQSISSRNWRAGVSKAGCRAVCYRWFPFQSLRGLVPGTRKSDIVAKRGLTCPPLCYQESP